VISDIGQRPEVTPAKRRPGLARPPRRFVPLRLQPAPPTADAQRNPSSPPGSPRVRRMYRPTRPPISRSHRTRGVGRDRPLPISVEMPQGRVCRPRGSANGPPRCPSKDPSAEASADHRQGPPSAALELPFDRPSSSDSQSVLVAPRRLPGAGPGQPSRSHDQTFPFPGRFSPALPRLASTVDLRRHRGRGRHRLCRW